MSNPKRNPGSDKPDEFTPGERGLLFGWEWARLTRVLGWLSRWRARLPGGKPDGGRKLMADSCKTGASSRARDDDLAL